MTDDNTSNQENQATIQPNIRVENVAAAVQAYEAVGFKKIAEFPGPDGNIVHAMVQIGNSPLHISPMGYNPQDATMDEAYENKIAAGPRGLGVTLYSQVPDVDAFHKTVTGAEGWDVKTEPETMFWGDRTFWCFDPFGYAWSFNTTVKKMTPEEMQEAMNAMATNA